MVEQRPSHCPKCGADLALKHPMWVNEELTRSLIVCVCGHNVYYTERRLPPMSSSERRQTIARYKPAEDGAINLPPLPFGWLTIAPYWVAMTLALRGEAVPGMWGYKP